MWVYWSVLGVHESSEVGYKGPSSGYGATVLLTPAVNTVATPTIRIGRSSFTGASKNIGSLFGDPQNKDYTVNM